MNRILSAVFGLIFAVTSNAALNPIKYTDYPHTNVFGLFDLFLFAKTNVALPTNYTIIGYEIINQLSNAVPTTSTNYYTTNITINTNTTGGESLWMETNGLVSLILGDTNSVKFSTNGRQGMIIGDTNRAFSFFGWPANDLTYINVRDGSPGHTVNQIFPVAVVDSTGSGAYEGFYTQSGANPIFSHSSVAVTNAVVATQLDEVAQKGGGYILLRDVGATNFVGIQNAGQLSTAIGPNHIRIFSHGGEKLILSTNGNVSFFGSATNYGILYARSNLVVVGPALFNDPVIMSDGALILQGLVAQGITNTLGFQTLGRISLGNSASDLTTSSNTLRQYGPTYLENATLTSNRVLYIDSGRLVATATFAPSEVSTIVNLMNASNVLSGLIGTPNLWTNDTALNVLRTIAGSTNFIGGGTENTISSNTAYATIAGGTTNAIGTNSSNSAIGGGTANTASFPNTTIAGGYGNTAAGTNSTVGGGYGNRTLASGTASGGSIIAGGVENLTADQFVTIAGGKSNSSYSPFSYIGGGGTNTIFGATDEGSETIGGGSGHSIIGAQFATIGGGAGNIINAAALASTIAGGSSNVIQSGVAPNASPNSFIGGGYSNTVVYPGPFNAIGGGLQNTLKATHGFVGGGYLNVIQTNATYSTIGGGRQNNIGTNSGSTTIGGGENNAIGTSSIYTTIAGGLNNTIQRGANGATILGGNGNTIQQDSQQTVIVGGANNSIGSNSIYSAILGGAINTIKTNTPYAFVIGNQVTASNASALEVRFTNTAGVVIDGANLHLTENMKIKMTNGAVNGYALVTDANGVGTWQSTAGGGGGGGANSGYIAFVTNTTPRWGDTVENDGTNWVQVNGPGRWVIDEEFAGAAISVALSGFSTYPWSIQAAGSTPLQVVETAGIGGSEVGYLSVKSTNSASGKSFNIGGGNAGTLTLTNSEYFYFTKWMVSTTNQTTMTNTFRAGLSDSVSASAEPSDGIYFMGNTNGSNGIVCVTSRSSSRTFAYTSVKFNPMKWYVTGFQIDRLQTNVVFYHGTNTLTWVPIATNSTTIPGGISLDPFLMSYLTLTNEPNSSVTNYWASYKLWQKPYD